MTDYLQLARQVLLDLRDRQDSTGNAGPAESFRPSLKVRTPHGRDVTASAGEGYESSASKNSRTPVLDSAQSGSDSQAENERRWAVRWPEKPYGALDDETGRWALEIINRAGTRIVCAEGKHALAVWPERRNDELVLALRLLRLDKLKLYSRGNPTIAKNIVAQYRPHVST